jgi:hypothetical protein
MKSLAQAKRTSLSSSSLAQDFRVQNLFHLPQLLQFFSPDGQLFFRRHTGHLTHKPRGKQTAILTCLWNFFTKKQMPVLPFWITVSLTLRTSPHIMDVHFILIK